MNVHANVLTDYTFFVFFWLNIKAVKETKSSTSHQSDSRIKISCEEIKAKNLRFRHLKTTIRMYSFYKNVKNVHI